MACTFDEFLWIQCNVITRNFAGPVVESETAMPPWLVKTNEKNQNAMMVPLIDMCNHWNHNNASYTYGKSEFPRKLINLIHSRLFSFLVTEVFAELRVV